MKRILFSAVFLMFLSSMPMNSAFAEDVVGSKDHPAVGRFKGSQIVHYEFKNFAEYTLPVGKMKKDAHDKTIKLEGKLTRLVYNAPPEASTLEIYRSYENELKKKGFQILFSCSKGTCGPKWAEKTYALNELVLKYGSDIGASITHGNKNEERFLAAKMEAPGGGEMYAAIFATTGWRNYPVIQMDIVEISGMSGDLVKVDPKELLNDIRKTGYASLYGIYFDVGKSDIKKESMETIGKIAELLKMDPGLSIYVVGHTDDTGDLEANMTLSKARAEAIAGELIKNHGVAEKRLSPHGVGPLSPVATNLNEEGRAKNRRVVLVQMIKGAADVRTDRKRAQERMEEQRKNVTEQQSKTKETMQKLMDRIKIWK
jgi:OOP family OmpA-OmpF porin